MEIGRKKQSDNAGYSLHEDVQMSALDTGVQGDALTRIDKTGLTARDLVASAMAGELTALGSYRYVASADAQGKATMEMSTINGPLLIQGTGSFEPASKKGQAMLIIAKNRNGPTDDVQLTFVDHSMRFTTKY